MNDEGADTHGERLVVRLVPALQDVQLGVVNVRVGGDVLQSVLVAQVLGAIEPTINQSRDVDRRGKGRRAHLVGARLALNSQWKTSTVFPSLDTLSLVLGLGGFGALSRRASTSASSERLIAPSMWPPSYS